MNTAERDSVICRLADEGRTLAQIATRLREIDPAWSLAPGSISRVLARRNRRRSKVRADAGKPRKPIAHNAEAALVALKMGIVSSSSPRPGKRVASALPTEVAIREAESRGLIAPGDINAAAFNRRLRNVYGIHQRGAEAKRTGPDAVRRFAARRAGARYQFDGTLLGQFYVDARGDIAYLPDTELKQQLKLAGRTRAHVLAWVDDYSRCVRLCACDGESARNVLHSARAMFVRSADPQQPFCGLPRVMYTDGGSGASSALALAAWRALSVRHVAHAPRSAWSKGKVEAAFRRTAPFQELTRGANLAGFDALNDFLRRIALELNNRPMDALDGRTPHDVFIESAAQQAAEGRWRYAPDDDALWRRLCMTRIDGLRVAADLTLSLGAGERLALPFGRPFTEWIGKRVALYVDAPPGAPVVSGADAGGSCFVVSPDGYKELEVPRVAPEVYASLLHMPAPDTEARRILALAQAAVDGGLLRGERGAWIGAGAPAYAAPGGVVVAPASASESRTAVETVTRHDVRVALLRNNMLDETIVEALMRGGDECPRADLDALLDDGVLPEHVARVDDAPRSEEVA